MTTGGLTIWTPDTACVCQRCEAYYDSPDLFWDGPDALRLQALPCHADEAVLASMIEDLDLGSELSDTELVPMLSDRNLMLRFSRLTQQLLEAKETLKPKTPEGRALHEQRTACLTEMKKRNLR